MVLQITVTPTSESIKASLGELKDVQAPGMPQLDFSTYPSQIFWLLVSLGILYLLLSRFALPRIETVIRDRQDTISKDLDQAAEFKRRAEEAELSYDEALSAAHQKAEIIAQRTRDEMKGDLEKSLLKADEEIGIQIEQSRQRIEQIEASASKNVKSIATDLVDDFFGKAVGTIVENKTPILNSAIKHIEHTTTKAAL